MINAKEAKQIATELLNEKSRLQLKDVEKRITDAANKGEFYCYFWGNLMPNVVYYLKQQGYIVKTQMDRNETDTIIRWDDV